MSTIERIIKKAKEVSLSSEGKKRIKQHLVHFIEKHPIKGNIPMIGSGLFKNVESVRAR